MTFLRAVKECTKEERLHNEEIIEALSTFIIHGKYRIIKTNRNNIVAE